MKLSDDKITHMTHVILKALLDKGIIDVTEEEGTVRRAMKRAIVAELQVGDDMDETVRKKIDSLSKHVAEGSPEWEVLYKKYYREEEVRKGRAG